MLTYRSCSVFVYVVALAIIGFPLNGSIPTPAGQFREATEVVVAASLIENKVTTAITWALIYSLSILIISCFPRKTLKDISTQPWILFILIEAIISALWSSNDERSLFYAMQFVGAFALCLVASQFYKDNIELLFKHSAVALGINLVLNFTAILVWPDATIHPNGRWAGVTGNANYLGALSFCSMWASLAWLSNRGRHKNVTGAAIIASLSLIVLVGSNSVTSIISSCVVVFVLALGMIRRRSRFRLVKSLLFYGLSMAFVALIFFLDIEKVFLLIGREDGATGRAGIWLATFEMIKVKPVLGYGFGSNAESLGVLHWATTFHNGYLEIAVRLGFVGLIVFLVWVSQILRSCIRKGHRQPQFWMCFAFVGAFLVYNLAESSIFMARNPVWLLFLTVSLSVTLRSDRDRITKYAIDKSARPDENRVHCAH